MTDTLRIMVDAAPLRPHAGDYRTLRAFADESGIPEERIGATYAEFCRIVQEIGLGKDGSSMRNHVDEAMLAVDALKTGTKPAAYRDAILASYVAADAAEGIFPAVPGQVAAGAIIRTHYPPPPGW